MDEIIKKTDHVAQINNNFGSKFSLVRGVGGTGKTIALLQSAWASYKEQSKRTLFLTYNHALSADVTRLKALMGVPSDLDEGGISICTVMSFMYRWLSYLGVIKGQEEDSFANYQDI